MTVIAWDGKTIAADRLVSCGGIIQETKKLYEGVNGCTLSFSGEGAKGLMMVAWFNDGADPDKWPEFQRGDNYVALIVADSQGVDVYYDEPVPTTFTNNFNAWGAGAEFAIGAMAAGKTAEEAVIIANDHCTGCGRGVDVIELN
jgi:hypothetical protein